MHRQDYTFDPRLAFASTIPARWYTDPLLLEEEKKKIFSRTWQLVGREEQVSEPGRFFTTEVADEPLLITRDPRGELRAYSNVCRHRAGPVACGQGRRMSFQCVYHGWTYSLDGALNNAPQFEGVENFDKASCRLPEFAIESFGGLLFVRLDPAGPSFSEVFEGIPALLEGHRLEGMRYAMRKEYEVACNWKVYIDNYLEGYHIPTVHPSLYKVLDYSAYRTETRRYYSLQHAPIRKEDFLQEKQPPGAEARYFWVFPNLMLNFYPGSLQTNLVLPLGVEKTLVIFEWFCHDPEREEVKEMLSRALAFADEVQDEDAAICEVVHKNLRSRTYSQGRYSVSQENGVHHFHGLLAEFLYDKNA